MDIDDNNVAIRSTPLPGQSTYCRIESIWENAGAYNQRFLLVLYDEYENPIAITTPEVGTGHPYITFKYDSWHRLREYRGEYSNGYFEFWHFYGFDLSGRIGVDTAYWFAPLSIDIYNYSDRIISKIEYDNQDRISKVIADYQLTNLHFETTYAYDAAGNLIYPGTPVGYDNKLNLHRANDIWMFLARDYSMNNPYVADVYSSTGLPTVINTDNSRYFTFTNLNIPLNHSQISYGCKQAVW
jgi:hypothetical protein